MTAGISIDPRLERRTRTRLAILEAAGELFSERGYEKTTIRAVAQRAGVDPGLVMQHFGSKSGLFGAVSEFGIGIGSALLGAPDELGERLIRHVLSDIERRPDGNLPVLRSMLTHPEAAEAVRCAVANPDDNPLTTTLTGDDAELRATLVGTIVLGLLVGRYLLRIPVVAKAPADRLVSLLGPSVQGLVGRASPPARESSALTLLAEAEAARKAAAEEVDRRARAALAAGASYGEVGRLVGISRQAARKRWADEEDE